MSAIHGNGEIERGVVLACASIRERLRYPEAEIHDEQLERANPILFCSG